MKKMAEGRKSQIVLLDERRLDIIIQPKLHAYELLDLVASHFKLREKHYFGLGYIDDTNHFTWLQADKKVLDHEFPKKTGLLVLYFSIRFYVETIGLLRDSQTIELFYLNARQVIFKGPVECDSETVFELAANVLQATNGDYATDEETREELKKLPLIPTSTLRERPSITYCEDRVIADYEKITGTSRGLAIVNYMTIVENLPTYGIHFYEVKDKKDIPWWLGISPKGIAVYDRDDKKTPRKLFTWKNLENLYYRDRKFSIEVSGPKRDESGNQVSVSRRTFGASNVDVHAWFAATAPLTKSIWSMAVSQHQFYLDRKQSKSQLPTTRSMSEIAAELCRSTASLPGSLGSDLSRSPSSHSLPSLSNSRYDLTIEQSDSLKAEREMVKALKARKEALEEALAKKTEELKRLCFEEGQLTGVLPHDTPLLAPGEQVPTFRRRVGTAFSLTVKDDKENDTQLSSELSKLELEVELQGKITSAAHRLASDKTVSKYVRKQRRQSYTRASGKLKEMEKKLGDMRRQLGKPVTEDGHRRMKEGMYLINVDHCGSPTKLPLDLTTTTTTTIPFTHPAVGSIQDQAWDRDTDSCGSSINSGDCSITSSADNDDVDGSVNYILHPCRSIRLSKGLRRASSQGSSLSASSELSYSISDVSERLDRMMDLNMMSEDSEKHSADSLEDIDSEEYSLTSAEKNHSKTMHYVVKRREGTPLLQERRKEFNRNYTLARFEDEVWSDSSSWTSSEFEKDETTKDYLTIDDARPREGSTSTLVKRRKQTIITGKRGSGKCPELLSRSCSINEGYKVFERHCLEDWIEEVNNNSHDNSQDGPNLSGEDDTLCSSDGYERSLMKDEIDARSRERYLSSSSDSRLVSGTDSDSDRSCRSSQRSFVRKRSTEFTLSRNSEPNEERLPRAQSHNGPRGRPSLPIMSCTRTVPQRSPSPDKSRISISSTLTRVLPVHQQDIGYGTVKGRSRHIIYARSKTPDLRRTKSSLSTPAPLVKQEDFDEEFYPVFAEEKKKDINCVSNKEPLHVHTSDRTNFPIRRGLSCPSINEDLSPGSGLETIV